MSIKAINFTAQDMDMGLKRLGMNPSPSKEMASGFDKEGTNFTEFLKNSMNDVNEYQKTADKMAQDLATGKSENLHETMLAISQAELSFNFMVQIRNKIVESYQEVLRMQV